MAQVLPKPTHLAIAVGMLLVLKQPSLAAGYLGPAALAISPDGKTMLVACADAKQVAWVDLAQQKVVRRVDVPYAPTGLALSPDGKTLYASCAAPRSTVVAMATGDGRITATFPAGHTASDVVISPDGRRLYVCNRFDCDVSVIDLADGEQLKLQTPPPGLSRWSEDWQLPEPLPESRTLIARTARPDGPGSASNQNASSCEQGRCSRQSSLHRHEVGGDACSLNKQIARIPADREPVAAAVAPDGRTLVVINHLPSDRADVNFISALVTLIDTATRKATTVRLPNGSTAVQSVCISPDGRYAYLTHVLANYELVPAQVDGGWTNTNALSVIDLKRRRLIDSVRLDDFYLGAGNPWGVTCTDDGRWIGVAHAGTHEVSLIDAAGLLAKLPGTDGDDSPSSSLYVAATIGGIPNDMNVLKGLRRRITLSGRGPRAVATSGSKLYVANYFSDTVDVIDVATAPRSKLRTIRLGPAPQPSARRRGEMLFHDASICYQQWQSCASCHPDARADTFNWDLINDGVGNPKNTKSMLWAHRTPPAMSTGVRGSAEVAVRSGLKHILFADLPDEDAAAIDQYLKSLRPAPSPHLLNGALSPSARRGKALFNADGTGCYLCHPAPLYTDLRKHDVGTQNAYDHQPRFDTPTLIETWRTAPYLHDGRYTTVKQLLTEGKHGLPGRRLERLSQQQIDDLIEFVLSL